MDGRDDAPHRNHRPPDPSGDGEPNDVLPPALGSKCFEPEPVPVIELNGRSAKVLEMKASGRTDEEVAEELGVSTKTVQRAKVDIAEAVKEAARR